MEAKNTTFVKKVVSPFAINTTMGFIVGGIPALLPLISDEFNLTRSQVGLYTTFMFMSSVSVALFAGYIVDRIGVKRCLTFGGIVSGSFVALFSVAPSYMSFLLFAVGLGFGQSILTPAGNKAIIDAREGGVSNLLMGLFRSTLGLGSLTGAAVLPLVAVNYGWRTSTLLGGAIGVTITVLLAFKRHDDNNVQNLSSARMKGSLKESVRVLARSSSLRFLMVTGFCFAAVFSISVTYLALWLRDSGGLSEYYAALGLALAHFGGVLGRPLLGFLSDRSVTLRPITLLVLDALAVAVILVVFAVFGSVLPGFILLLISFFLGFTAMGFGGVFFGFLGVVAGRENAGVATGMVLMFIRSAILAAPPVFGLIVDKLDSYTVPWLIAAAVIVIPAIYHLLRVKKTASTESSPD